MTASPGPDGLAPQPQEEPPAPSQPATADTASVAPAAPAVYPVSKVDNSPARKISVNTLLGVVEEDEAINALLDPWLTPDDARQALRTPPAPGYHGSHGPTLRASTAPADMTHCSIHGNPRHLSAGSNACGDSPAAASRLARPVTAPALDLHHTPKLQLHQAAPKVLYVDLQTSHVSVARPKAGTHAQHPHAPRIDKFRWGHRKCHKHWDLAVMHCFEA